MHLGETPTGFALTLEDETGAQSCVTLTLDKTLAQNAGQAEAALREHLGKLGNTIFVARDIVIDCSAPWFIPASAINALRRDAVVALEAARAAALPRWTRHAEAEPPAIYPETSLSYLANVYNAAARRFYTRHGVRLIAEAYEAHKELGEVSVMVTKHCLRFSFNLCPKQAKGVQGVQGQVRAEPMVLVSGEDRMTLRFDCKPCEMHVISKIRKNVLQSPPPTTVTAPLTFHRVRP